MDARKTIALLTSLTLTPGSWLPVSHDRAETLESARYDRTVSPSRLSPGSGQVEIDIVKASDTTMVLLAPGSGDEIQTMKAGILEAVDIFVINKADREGVENLRNNLEAMLTMKERRPEEWQPGIILTEAVTDKGTEELAAEIQRNREFLIETGDIKRRQRDRARLELLETAEGFVKDWILRIDQGDYLEKLIDKLLQGRASPRRASQEIARRFAAELGRLETSESSGGGTGLGKI